MEAFLGSYQDVSSLLDPACASAKISQSNSTECESGKPRLWRPCLAKNFYDAMARKIRQCNVNMIPQTLIRSVNQNIAERCLEADSLR
jgi:hypothetical protein